MFTTHRGTEAPKPDGIPIDIAEALIRFSPRLDGFATHVVWNAEVGSTNDVAISLAEQGWSEGTLVGADRQTRGRGRHGRVWVSPPGAGLYISIVLKPSERMAPLVTIAAGIAIVEGIREATGLTASLKWPNDVFASGRKLAGILAEAGMSSSRINFAVLGVGINLMPAAYPPEVASRATSLELELGRPVDRGLVLAACLAALVERYRQLGSSQTKQLIDAWRALGASMFGRPVECVREDGRISGVAEDIDEQGALVVRASGNLIRVVSGEVLWH